MSTPLRCVLVLGPASLEAIETALAPWLMDDVWEDVPGRKVWSTSLSVPGHLVETLEISHPDEGFRVWESETFALPHAVCDCGHALLREEDDGSFWVVDECPRCEESVQVSQLSVVGRDPWTGDALGPGPGVAHRRAVIVHMLFENDKPVLPPDFLRALQELRLKRVVFDAG